MRCWLLLLLLLPAASACSPPAKAPDATPVEWAGMQSDRVMFISYGQAPDRQVVSFEIDFDSPVPVSGVVTGTFASGQIQGAEVHGGYYNPGGLCFPQWMALEAPNAYWEDWYPLRLDGPRIVTDLEGRLWWLDAQGSILHETRVGSGAPTLAMALWDGVLVANGTHAFYRTMQGGWDVEVGGDRAYAGDVVHLVGSGHATTIGRDGQVQVQASFPGPRAPLRAGDFWVQQHDGQVITVRLDGSDRQVQALDGDVLAYPNGTFAMRHDGPEIGRLWVMDLDGRFREVAIPDVPWRDRGLGDVVKDVPAPGILWVLAAWVARRR